MSDAAEKTRHFNAWMDGRTTQIEAETGVIPTASEVDILADEYKDAFIYKGQETRLSRMRDTSIQTRATDPDSSIGAANILSRIVKAGEIISPWWSVQRDVELRRFWKGSNHLSGAVRAFTSKIATLDFRVLPTDPSIARQVAMADDAYVRLLEFSEYGAGWNTLLIKWVQDMVTTDNGGFMEIVGAGSPSGPIVGAPIGLAHLDSLRCRRTSNPEFPVVYQDTDGKWYKMHYTRVIYASLMTSSDVTMNGVGFSSCSSAIDIAQNLMDITRYKQEKLGSRPPRAMLVGKNISAQEIFNAFLMANEQMDNQRLGIYSKFVALGNKRKEIGIDMVDLASVPDGFDEETSVTLGMFAIALAFEMDARELWPSTISGATKADAMIQHLKARRKGAGQIMQLLARQINQKFLPPTLTFSFDVQDDEQDMLQADVQDRRSISRERDLNDAALTIRVAHERMLDKGEITKAQFAQMELEDGRLDDGTPVLALFYTTDPDIRELLPFDKLPEIGDNEGSEGSLREDKIRGILREIDAAIGTALERILNASHSGAKWKARQALAALETLRSRIAPPPTPQPETEVGRPQERTQADAERIRNEDDYRPEGESDVVERL